MKWISIKDRLPHNDWEEADAIKTGSFDVDIIAEEFLIALKHKINKNHPYVYDIAQYTKKSGFLAWKRWQADADKFWEITHWCKIKKP
jgi:hypothetical protein